MESFSEKELKLRIPSGIMIGGSCQSGKTGFVMKLLSNVNHLMDPIPKKILYCYGQFGNHIKELEKNEIQTHSGIPPDDLLEKQPRPFLLILDDLMDTVDEKWLTSVYTKKSHHMQFGVIFICQNLFDKKLHTARVNSQYLVLTNSPNNLLGVRTLASQIFPGRTADFFEAYNQITKFPYGYLLIDLHYLTPPKLRLRTNIFPDELTSVYTI